MSADSRLRVVLCWHMHQPEYRNMLSGEYVQPWSYLHAIKDYTDMAAHLEAVPGAHAVVNFSAVLLDQIADYATQVRGFLDNGLSIRDPLLAALDNPALPSGAEQRIIIIRKCLRANEARLIERFPAFKRLAEMARWLIRHPGVMSYVADQFLGDLLVWYHLAWLGETVRRTDARVKRLMDKGDNYTLHDRRELLMIIGELLSGITERYARLARSGQVELSVTPYAHPMLPLLIDFSCAHDALPDIPLPQTARYPGGEARAQWHIQQAIATFERAFGFRPTGCWPSEGGVSEATLRLLEKNGFRWAASGGRVLHNSLESAGTKPPVVDAHGATCLHRAYRLADSRLACFFRDDGLSDLIGFTYADWHADDAVANLVEHLENIHAACSTHADAIVSIIMDGENAWEYYPENGYYFLRALYQKLSNHPRLALTTYNACVADGVGTTELARLTAGSWVYGNFATWIGERDKNRGWDMLVDAKQAFDRNAGSGRIQGDRLVQAEHQLAICEGSDWFWWFGDLNPAEAVGDFEHLYRQQLANLYQLIGEEPPQYLSQVFTRGSGAPAMGGVMRPGVAG